MKNILNLIFAIIVTTGFSITSLAQGVDPNMAKGKRDTEAKFTGLGSGENTCACLISPVLLPDTKRNAGVKTKGSKKSLTEVNTDQ